MFSLSFWVYIANLIVVFQNSEKRQNREIQTQNYKKSIEIKSHIYPFFIRSGNNINRMLKNKLNVDNSFNTFFLILHNYATTKKSKENKSQNFHIL